MRSANERDVFPNYWSVIVLRLTQWCTLWDVSLIVEGMSPMVARQHVPVARAHSGAVNGRRMLFMGTLLLLIAVASVSGIVFAMSSGQPQVALIIGLISAAFFSRIRC